MKGGAEREKIVGSRDGGTEGEREGGKKGGREGQRDGERTCEFYSLRCRKYTLILNNILVFLGVGLESLAVHPGMLIAGRFIVGISAGKREGQRVGEREGRREGESNC